MFKVVTRVSSKKEKLCHKNFVSFVNFFSQPFHFIFTFCLLAKMRKFRKKCEKIRQTYKSFFETPTRCLTLLHPTLCKNNSLLAKLFHNYDVEKVKKF